MKSVSHVWLPAWIFLFIKVADTVVEYHWRALYLNDMLLLLLLLLIFMYVFKYNKSIFMLNTIDDIYSQSACCCLLFTYGNVSHLFIEYFVRFIKSFNVLCDVVVCVSDMYNTSFILKYNLILLYVIVTKVSVLTL
jgi:hypothetical protein